MTAKRAECQVGYEKNRLTFVPVMMFKSICFTYDLCVITMNLLCIELITHAHHPQ